jgi:hypothetical protein
MRHIDNIELGTHSYATAMTLEERQIDWNPDESLFEIFSCNAAVFCDDYLCP